MRASCRIQQHLRSCFDISTGSQIHWIGTFIYRFWYRVFSRRSSVVRLGYIWREKLRGHLSNWQWLPKRWNQVTFQFVWRVLTNALWKFRALSIALMRWPPAFKIWKTDCTSTTWPWHMNCARHSQFYVARCRAWSTAYSRWKRRPWAIFFYKPKDYPGLSKTSVLYPWR